MAENMVTVTIQLGNSDNKLSQIEWASFVAEADSTVRRYTNTVHFCGAPASTAPYQNFAMVIDISESELDLLKGSLKRLREVYFQDSIALTVGTTEFI
jgi:hypothetical protein